MEPTKRATRCNLTRHTDLDVYRRGFKAAMDIFQASKSFPFEERFSLTDQVRRSSRAVCANVAEAWRKRRYPAAFVSKLSDSEAEAAETQTWIQFAVECGYVPRNVAVRLYKEYDAIVAMLVRMLSRPEDWSLKKC